MQLFYNATLDHSFKQFFFNTDESRHLAKVMRKKEGDLVHITNGKGILFTAKILIADPKKCKAQIVDEIHTVPRRYSLHMAVAPTKMNDRFEWFLEKATEIGVSEITPILCERSERKHLKLERCGRVIQAAMKQSLQTYLPKMHPLTPLPDFLAKTKAQLKFVAHCADGEKEELKRRAAADKDTVVLIGPEGDFSDNEIRLAQEKGYMPIMLGKTRLRTETAAIVACSSIAMING